MRITATSINLIIYLGVIKLKQSNIFFTVAVRRTEIYMSVVNIGKSFFIRLENKLKAFDEHTYAFIVHAKHDYQKWIVAILLENVQPYLSRYSVFFSHRGKLKTFVQIEDIRVQVRNSGYIVRILFSGVCFYSRAVKFD